MSRNLDGMVVAITGASAGIGKSLVEKLHARGAKLALCARRVDRLEELNKQFGGGLLCVRADVAKPSECAMFILAAAEHFGRIDTLVCNAGYGFVRTIADTTHEDMLKIFETNVFGTTDVIRAALPIMKRQPLRDDWRGQIMIVSSAAARRGLPYFGPYAATKAAQLSIAEALRVELKRDRIAVTSVHPVGTNTEFFEVAEKQSGMRRPVADTKVRQTASTVARKMMYAIERPRTELWPLRAARWVLGTGAMMPGLVDRMMAKYHRQIEDMNRP
jgi:NADP-dependent 3-hydroxy acid dehydrogenase YdfG